MGSADVLHVRWLAEADNNIAKNVLQMVSMGRKNYLFFGSDRGGERETMLYSLIGTCKLDGVKPERYFRYILASLQTGQ